MEAGIDPVLRTGPFDKREKQVLSYDGEPGMFIFTRNGKNQGNWDLSCHNKIRDPRKGIPSNVVTSYNGDPEGADVYLQYITSKNGPFRKLMALAPTKWEFLTKDKKVYAIKIPDEVFHYPVYPLVYNFLIASRLPGELGEGPVNAFARMVKLGINPNLAYVLCIKVTWSNFSKEFQESHYQWDGMHVHFNEEDGYIDYRRICQGEYSNPETSWKWSSRIHHIPLDQLSTDPKTVEDFNFHKYVTQKKSKFSHYNIISEENLVKLSKDFEQHLLRNYK